MLPGQACNREKRDKDEKLFIQQRQNKSHNQDLTVAMVCQIAKSALFFSRFESVVVDAATVCFFFLLLLLNSV